MLTIVQRGGATREKPPEVVRGYASRLPWAWDGLCFAAPFNDATQDSARDLVTNAAPSEWYTSVAPPSWTKDNRGNVAIKLPYGTYLGYADNPMHKSPTTALTAYVRFRRIAGNPPGWGFFAKVHTPAVDPYDTWGIQYTSADATKLSSLIAVNGVYRYWENADYIVDTATWLSVFLRWTSGTAPVQEILSERGQILSSSPLDTALTGTLAYSTGRPIRINATDDPPPGAGETVSGDYSQAMLWSRRLTDTELQAIVADPYGWYSPRRETIGVSSPYPLVFGGGEMRHGTTIGGLR
jgi:hypothetical protein